MSRLTKAFLLLLSGLAVASILPVPSRASDNPNVKLILHLVPVDDVKHVTCVSHKVSTFKDVITKGDLNQDYYAYVILADYDTTIGMAGVQFGISYNDTLDAGVDIDAWQHCVLLEWPMDEWPGANSGNLLTWSQWSYCQHIIPLVVGYFTLTAHSPDRLKLIPRPVDGLARTVACGINSINSAQKLDDIKPENLAWLDFGGGEGYNPWDPGQNLLNLKKRFTPIK